MMDKTRKIRATTAIIAIALFVGFFTSLTSTAQEPNEPPVAGFDYWPTGSRLVAPVQITYNGLGNDATNPTSYDTDGEIVSYEWAFTGGEDTTKTGSDVNNIYRTPGTFTTTLTVTDNDGATGSLTTTLIILSGTSTTDTDNDGVADSQDDDIDGDGIPNDEDTDMFDADVGRPINVFIIFILLGIMAVALFVPPLKSVRWWVSGGAIIVLVVYLIYAGVF